jgi:hypothetical protein
VTTTSSVEEEAWREKSIKNTAYEILAASGGPTHYRRIAEQMRKKGFAPAPDVKNPGRQFVRSVWVALTRDDRVVKVGPGTFDLAKRRRSAR